MILTSSSANKFPPFALVLVFGFALGPLIYLPDLQHTVVKLIVGSLIVMAALLLWLTTGDRNGPLRIVIDKDAALWLAILFWAILSGLAAVDKRVALIGVYGHNQGLIALSLLISAFILLKQMDWTPARYRFLVTVLVAGGAAQALAAWVQMAGGVFGFEFLGAGLKSLRTTGTFANANVFGSYMTPMIPLSAALAQRATAGIRPLAYLGVAFVLIAALSTLSISVWLATAVMGAVAVVDRIRRGGFNRSFLVASAAAVSLAAGFLLFSGGGRLGAAILQRVANAAAVSGSAGSRFPLWEAALRLASSRPLLGWGPDSFGVAAPGPGLLAGPIESPAHPHNLMLEFAANMGLPAALLFAVLIAFSLMRFWRRRPPEGQSRWSDDPGLWIGLAVIGQLTVILTQSLNFFPFMLLLILLYLQAGLEKQPAWSLSFSKAARIIATAGVLGVYLISFWAGARVLAAERQYHHSLRAGDTSAEAVALARQAISLNPHFPVYVHRLARVYLARTAPGQESLDYREGLQVVQSPGGESRDPVLPMIEARLHEKRGGDAAAGPAIKAAKRALELHPHSSKARRILGDLYFAKKDYRTASRHYARAAEGNPGSYDLWVRLAWTRNKARDRQGAVKAYQRASAVGATDENVSILVGLMIAQEHLDKGTPEGLRLALIEAESVIAKKPGSTAALAIAGKASFAMKDYETAAGHYKTLSLWRPGSFYPLYQLAKSRRKANDVLGALEAYEAAVKIKPDSPDALREIEKIKIRLRNERR